VEKKLSRIVLFLDFCSYLNEVYTAGIEALFEVEADSLPS
jgi:hypothetical protein